MSHTDNSVCICMRVCALTGVCVYACPLSILCSLLLVSLPLSPSNKPCMSPDLGKPSVWDFFQKIEFDAWLIISTIELTRVQVLGRSCAWLWRYSALFAIAPHPQ